MNLFDLPRTEEETIKFLQEKGLLPNRRLCKNKHKMRLSIGNEVKWQCQKQGCSQKIRMRVGNFLKGTRLPFVTCVRFFYGWALEYSSGKFCKRECGMDEDTTVDWSNYMRAACIAHQLNKEHQKIGGEGLIVDTDESLFTKRKNNAGRVLPQQWIFGGLCRETRQCFLVQVPDRSAPTLLDAIKDNIAEGSTIFSDSWRRYKTTDIEKEGFEHFKVNHRFNFIDPETGTHTQTVERMWGSAKWRNKKHRGTARHHLESYLAEFMCRQEFKEEDSFDWILQLLAKFWPPDE